MKKTREDSKKEFSLMDRSSKRTCPEWRIGIPTSFAEIRNKMLIGSKSIVRSLPHPDVHTCKDHAYLSIIECVVDFLGHGFDFDLIESDNVPDVVRRTNESKAASEIFKRAKKKVEESDADMPFVLYLVEWFDDLDPNSSTKNHRGGVFIKTITIGCTKGDRNSYNNTYVVAVGPKDADHEEVQKIHAAEMIKLRNENVRCFSKKLGGVVNVHVEVIASLADQLARREATFISAGNGTYGARWAHSGDFRNTFGVVPSCRDCYVALINKNSPRRSCQVCTCWNLIPDSDSNLLDFDVPAAYPTSEIPVSGKIKPAKLSFDKLTAAVEKAHDKIVSGEWSTSQAECFLKVTGLNTLAQKKVTEHAENNRLWNTALDRKDENEITKEAYELLLVERNEAKYKFEKWPVPSLWDRGMDLSQHVDVIMHLLFEGVCKAVIKLIHAWATTPSRRF